jgi:polysaccharide biosynthesis transport protein
MNHMVFKATKEDEKDIESRPESVASDFINSDEMNLHAYLSLLRRHWFFSAKIFLTTLLLTIPLILLLKPSYIAEGKIKFLKVDRSSSLAGLSKETGELTPLVSTQNPLNTEIEVIKSKPLIKKVIKDLNLADNQGQLLNSKNLLKKIDVKVIGGTDVILLTYEGRTPNESANVINTLMKLYIQNEKISRRQDAIQAREFIAKQIPPSMQAVQQADKALRSFKEKNKIVALSERLNAAEAERANLENKFFAAKVELDEVAARSNSLKQQLNLSSQDAADISNIAQSESTRNTLKELQDTEQKLTTFRKIYQDSHPEIIRLSDQRNGLRSVLAGRVEKLVPNKQLTNIPTIRVGGEIGDENKSQLSDFLTNEAQKAALRKRLNSLDKVRASHATTINSLPRLQQTLVELERRQSVAQSTYQALLTRFQELQVTQEEYVSNAKIIESAEAPTEGSLGLKPYIIIVFGILLGTFLATASIPLLQMWETWKASREKNRSDLEVGFYQHSLELSNSQNLSADTTPPKS